MSRLEGRNRLPDILIGLVVVALLVGFAALLFGQKRTTTEVAQTRAQVTAPPEIPSAPGAPAKPQTAAETSSAQATREATGQDEDGETASKAATEKVTITPAPAVTAPSSPETGEDTAPGTQEAADAPDPAVSPDGNSQAAAPDTDTTAPSTAAPTAVAPQAGGAVPASADRVPTRNDYRISLGGFNSTTAAVNQTAAVAALGYTVYSIDLGNQVVAQVGPFADADTAQRALADIQRAYPKASLFAPRAGATAPATAPTSPAPATSRAPSSAPAATQTPPQQAAQPAQQKPAQQKPAQQRPVQAAPQPASPQPAAQAPTTRPPASRAQAPAAQASAPRTPPARQTPPQQAAQPAQQKPTQQKPVQAAPKPAQPAPQASAQSRPAQNKTTQAQAPATPARSSRPSAPTAPAQAAQAPSARAAQPAPAQASAGPVYLQVGAFDEPDRAQQLVSDLQSQGFSPSVNAPEGERVRVIIGPFGSDEVARAEAQLDASGYDHFRLR